jgi:hypothetical protein
MASIVGLVAPDYLPEMGRLANIAISAGLRVVASEQYWPAAELLGDCLAA